MSKAAYWQRGEALDYVNSGTTKIEANTVIVLGGVISVAGMETAPGETGTVHVTGVFEMPKTGTAAISMGQKVYFDGNGITNAADDGATTNKTEYTLAGYAAAAAAAADQNILVKINA